MKRITLLDAANLCGVGWKLQDMWQSKGESVLVALPLDPDVLGVVIVPVDSSVEEAVDSISTVVHQCSMNSYVPPFRILEVEHEYEYTHWYILVSVGSKFDSL